MSRSRVGLALSGAAILFACGGVAAAAAGSPPDTGPSGDQPTLSVSTTPTASPSPSDADDADTDDDGIETAGDADDEAGDEAGEGAGEQGTTEDQDAAETATGGVGPDAAGPAHHGLCTAWSHVQDTPGKAADSTAFRNVALVDCSDVTPGEEPAEDDPADDADESGTDSGVAEATSPASTGKGHGKAKVSTHKDSKKKKASKGKGSSRTTGATGRH